MSFKFKRAICLLLSGTVASSVFSWSAYAENENTGFSEVPVTSEDTVLQTDPLEREDWLSVANEVITYYSELSAGNEPLITEKNWRFYDVIPDKSINMDDVSFFLELYAVCGSGTEYAGYVPERNGEYSTLVTTVPAETTTTAISEITTFSDTQTAIPVITTTPYSEESSNTTITTVTTVPEETVSSEDTSSVSAETTSATKIVTTTKTTVTAASKTTDSGLNVTSTASGITSTCSGETEFPVSTETNVTETTTATATTTVITRTPFSYGIDVSVYQGNIDWKEVKESGVEFAIIRAGYGKHISQEDKYFDQNMKNAKAAGIDCGAYWFSYATTPEAAELEADVFYEVIKDYKFEYPVFFDYETNAQYKLTPEESTEIIEAFCKRMESYGYYVSLCSYVNFLNTRIEPEVFNTYDAWIAHYNVQVPNFQYSHGMWQYSCTGKVSGVDTDVDLNYAYYNYPKIMKDMKLNGFE